MRILKTHPDFNPRPPASEKQNPHSLAYSDIELSRWRDYDEIETGSLWMFNSRDRGNGHQLDYHGNFIPQVARQLIFRYTRRGEVVLDLFLGSGTTAIEAVNTGRRCVGVDIKPELVEYVRGKVDNTSGVRLIVGDSGGEDTACLVRQSLCDMGCEHAHLLILHPPYWDIIRFSESESDLSNAQDLECFLCGLRDVAKNGFELLQPGRFAGLVIGDKYANGELIPLGFYSMQVMMEAGFRLKSVVVKNIEGNEKGKGKNANLWRYRALAGGFYIFKHEYVMIFQKPC